MCTGTTVKNIDLYCNDTDMAALQRIYYSLYVHIDLQYSLYIYIQSIESIS